MRDWLEHRAVTDHGEAGHTRVEVWDEELEVAGLAVLVWAVAGEVRAAVAVGHTLGITPALGTRG